MDLKKELIFGEGFKIIKIPNLKKFKYLRNSFLNKMGLRKKNINYLRKTLATLKNHQVNKTMVKLLSFNEASEMMIESCNSIIKELCGKSLLIQRRANTIFNLPGEDQRRQWPHYELMSGISPVS